MQLQNDDEEEETAGEHAANDTSGEEGASRHLQENPDDVLQAAETTETLVEEGVTACTEEPNNDQKESVSHEGSDSHTNEAPEGEDSQNNDQNDSIENEADKSSNSNEVGEEVKESDV